MLIVLVTSPTVPFTPMGHTFPLVYPHPHDSHRAWICDSTGPFQNIPRSRSPRIGFLISPPSICRLIRLHFAHAFPCPCSRPSSLSPNHFPIRTEPPCVFRFRLQRSIHPLAGSEPAQSHHPALSRGFVMLIRHRGCEAIRLPLVVCASPTFCHLTGYSKQEVLGHNCCFLQPPTGNVAKGEPCRFTSQDVQNLLTSSKECQTMLIKYRKDG